MGGRQDRDPLPWQAIDARRNRDTAGRRASSGSPAEAAETAAYAAGERASMEKTLSTHAARKANSTIKKSCGNRGAVESVEIQRQDFPSSHRPLGISQKREIPTFPQLRRLGYGKVENQKQVSHFPTAVLSISGRTKQPTASAKKRGRFYRGKNGDISNEA